MYKKYVNPTEKEVSELLQQGYTLHSITPIMECHHQYNYTLIYHFTRQYYIGVDYSKPLTYTEITCSNDKSIINENLNNPYI
jgi:hypothetical protein